MESTLAARDLVRTHLLPLLADKMGAAEIDIVGVRTETRLMDGRPSHVLVGLSPAVESYVSALTDALKEAKKNCQELQYARLSERSVFVVVKGAARQTIRTTAICIPRQPQAEFTGCELFWRLFKALALIALCVSFLYWLFYGGGSGSGNGARPSPNSAAGGKM